MLRRSSIFTRRMETATRAAEATGRTQMKQHRDDGLSAFHSGSRSIGSLGRKAPLEAEMLESRYLSNKSISFFGACSNIQNLGAQSSKESGARFTSRVQ